MRGKLRKRGDEDISHRHVNRPEAIDLGHDHMGVIYGAESLTAGSNTRATGTSGSAMMSSVHDKCRPGHRPGGSKGDSQ